MTRQLTFPLISKGRGVRLLLCPTSLNTVSEGLNGVEETLTERSALTAALRARRLSVVSSFGLATVIFGVSRSVSDPESSSSSSDSAGPDWSLGAGTVAICSARLRACSTVLARITAGWFSVFVYVATRVNVCPSRRTTTH